MSMTLVSTVTVGSGGAANIEFTSIPQTATDLFLVISARSNRASVNPDCYLQFNTTTTGYSGKNLIGSGSAASSYGYISGETTGIEFYIDGANATASTFGNAAIYMSNYSGSTNKSVSVDSVVENNATAADLRISAGLWANTAAITSIKLFRNATNFDQYSTASLYLITKGSGGATTSP